MTRAKRISIITNKNQLLKTIAALHQNLFLPFDKILNLRYHFSNRFEHKRGNCDAKTGTGPQGRAA
jgi:hypothetical protein